MDPSNPVAGSAVSTAGTPAPGPGSSLAPTPAPGSTPRSAKAPRDPSVWVALTLVVLMAGLIRCRLLSVPLERDEGEYAYAGQLILEGQPPYVQMYNMKMPGIYAIYAVILGVFGQTHVGIHAALLLVNAGAILLVFLLGRRLLGEWPAVGAAAVFALFSLHSDVQGIFANAEQFLLVPVLAGLLVVVGVPKSGAAWRVFWAGVLLGLGFIIKQHAAAFMLWAGLYLVGRDLLARPRRWRQGLERGLMFSAGGLAPFVAVCVVFVMLGWVMKIDALGRFWFWTVTYSSHYIRQTTLSDGWYYFRLFNPYHLGNATLPLWGLALLGLPALAWDPAVRRAGVFLVGLLVFSAVAISPGLFFRPHYFVLTLPATALWAGAALCGVRSLLWRAGFTRVVRQGAPVVLLLAALGYTVFESRDYLFWTSPDMVAHSLYESDPFPEALVVADYIRKHSKPTDKILVMGSEPEIYFYAHRHSATGYIYMYPLMQPQPFALDMQVQMIAEAEASKPEYLVFVGVQHSWDYQPTSPRLVFEWLTPYRRDQFERVGLVDSYSYEHPAYYWGKDAERDPLSRVSWMTIYRRRAKPLAGH